jgi:anti-sigma factor RsiW
MSPDAFPCAQTRALLTDWLDGLLDEPEAARVFEHLADCAPCAAEANRTRRVQAALAAPWDVPAPSADLPLLALAAARTRRSSGRRVTGTLLRYGATFAAGVLAAFLVLRAEPTQPATLPTPVAAAQPAPEPTAVPELVSVSFTPRRIH